MAKAVNAIVKAGSLGLIDMEPKAPKLPDVKTAPDPELENATKSRALQRRKRSGRTSTVLTGSGSPTLG